MEWEAPAIVLDARPYGEGGALVTVLTETEGVYRALVRGGGSRGQAATWQQGNLVQGRWVARLAEQLGSLSGELIHSGAAPVVDDALAMSVLASACAVAAGALPEREAHPGVFAGLVRLIAAAETDPELVAALVRWEAVLLAELGYGLDLDRCTVTGATAGLAFVSPRTGRAVAQEAAGVWAERLLRLPGFLAGSNRSEAADWRDGLLLTGHFLARDAFGQRHVGIPEARLMLLDRVSALAAL